MLLQRRFLDEGILLLLSQGKFPCERICGTVKRKTARASLQGVAPKLRLPFVVTFHKNEFKFLALFFSSGFFKQL